MSWNKFIVIVELCALGSVCVSAAYYPPRHCAACEEEVWEEVPCNRVPTSTTPRPGTTTTTTTPRPTQPPITYAPPITYKPPIAYTPPITYAPPITYKPPITYTPPTVRPPTLPAYTPPPLPGPTPTTPLPPYTQPTLPPVYPLPPTSYGKRPAPAPLPSPLPPTNEPPSTELYKQCYCDCKLGCKEFCRKLNQQANEVNPPMQITQITKTVQKLPGGRRVETKHEHKYLAPTSSASSSSSSSSSSPAGSSDLYQPPSAPPAPPSGYDSGKSYGAASGGGDGSGYAPLAPSASTYDNDLPPYSNSNNYNYNKKSSKKPPGGYANALLDASSYTVEELSRLLQLEAVDKTRYTSSAYEAAPSPSPPPPLPSPLPPLPLQYAPVYSNVLTSDDDDSANSIDGKSVSARAQSHSKGTALKDTGAYTTTNYLIKDVGQYAELSGVGGAGGAGGGYPTYDFAMDNYFKHASSPSSSSSSSPSSDGLALSALPYKTRPLK